MARDLYKYFRVEAHELLDGLGKAVLGLEKDSGQPDLIPRFLRLAHTLKGAARVVKQREIADQAHAVEDALAPFRESGGPVPRERIKVVLTALHEIAGRVAALTPPAADALAPARSPGDEALRTVRADVAEMDALLDSVAEAHAQLSSLRRSVSSLERARRLADLLVEQLGAPRARSGNGFPAAQSMAEELRTAFGSLERGLVAGVDRIDRELREVRDTAEQLRLVPAGALFTSLERTARDIAHAQGKEVAFEARGSDVHLDAHLLATVQSALVQVVRNAVAHGIEAVPERQAAGKPPTGRLTLEVARRGRKVAFTFTDDGQGVDLDAVRQVAERKGLLSEETRRLGTEELMRLLLRGGITTSRAVTDVSGRGVGLDVVREAAERLGGGVSVRTEAGQGTTVELVVPLSLASLEALLVESSGAAAAIPLDAVRGALRILPGAVARTAEGESLLHEGRAFPLLSLARSLHGRSIPSRAAPARSAVLVETAGGCVAVAVDRLLGTSNVVLRPLPELAPATAIVAGSSLDTEGNPQLVLDPDGLVAEALRPGRAPKEPESRRHPVLVIDDSLTTRMLEQSILESAGYDVDAATSGEEALEKARGKQYALFLVDVEMPGMDGFEFIERSRGDPSLRDVPAILVTSRSSADDRRRGQDVGAQGYIAKSEFDQNELLGRIRSLVG